MVKQSTKNQYDDDLTLGNDDYDESYYSDADDLFEFSTDDESPISRLKSLVLSIDWEITDEVLLQFNEELLDLKGIWAGETTNLVYVQALEKISKYIYQNKADSHPNAIKLLLTFYYNLEKIVSSQELSEEQKKETLLDDIKKFENLKRQIKQKSISIPPRKSQRSQNQKVKKEDTEEDELLNLRAIVLGIDWEITDQDLNDLRREVFRLEEKLSESRPKLILLQGIGTLAAYIKVKKSNAHPDAFKVMQLFYDSLEKIVKKPMSLEAEKAILFPVVEKFYAFKALLGPTISPDAIIKKDEEAIEEYGSSVAATELSPALADVTEEEQVGFQAEKEAMAMGLNDSGGVASHIEDFFGESATSQMFSEEVTVEPRITEDISDALYFTEDPAVVPVEKNFALQGVDVDGDGDEEELHEEDVPAEGIFAPLGIDEPATLEKEASIFAAEPDLIDTVVQQEVEDQLNLTEDTIVGATESIFPVDDREFLEFSEESSLLDREKALQGVDVETEADDDTDELSLPMEGEELAPALASMEEESLFSAKTLERAPISSSVSEEIVGTIDGLFLDHDGSPDVPGRENLREEKPAVSSNIEETNGDNLIGFEDWLKEDSKEEEPLFEAVGEEANQEINYQSSVVVSEEPEPVLGKIEVDDELKAVDFADAQEEAALSSFFTDSDLEQSSKDGSEIDALFDSLETDLGEGEEKEDVAARVDDVERNINSDMDQEKTVDEELSVFFQESRGDDTVEVLTNDHSSDAHLAEDEVVFELYEEEIQKPVTVDQGDDEGYEELFVENEFMADESLNTELLGATGKVFTEEWADGRVVAIEEQKNPQPLEDIQTCIHSLKIEISETIIVGLFQEINALRQKWADKPLELTFLQLLSTITQHINSYRYESSAEAHGLLVSICQALVALKEDDPTGNQQLLFGETLKVLEWQQGMLSRQAVKKGDQLTFADPVRTENEGEYQSDAQKDFDDLLEQYEEPVQYDNSHPHEFHGEKTRESSLTQSPSEEIGGKEEMLVDGEEELMQMSFADDLRSEIAALRQTLQMEIAELRKDLIKD